MTTTSAQMDAIAAMKGAVIGTATDGSTWAGTKCWLIRDDTLSRPTPEQMDNVVARDFTVPLERVCHGRIPVLVQQWGSAELERGYERPDGVTIWLNEAIVEYLDTYFEGLDEETGNSTPADLVARHVENRWGPVGFFQQDVLVAVVMPIHHMNEQLTDGKGGDIDDTSYEEPARG